MKYIINTLLFGLSLTLWLSPHARVQAADKSGWLRNGPGQIIGSVPGEELPKGIRGAFVSSIQPDGTIVTQNEDQKIDGKIIPPGYICPHDVPEASYEQDGIIRDRQGEVLGEVSRDGVVMRADGKIIATMPATPVGRSIGAMILVKNRPHKTPQP